MRLARSDSWPHLPYFRHHSQSLSIVMSLIRNNNSWITLLLPLTGFQEFPAPLSLVEYLESWTIATDWSRAAFPGPDQLHTPTCVQAWTKCSLMLSHVFLPHCELWNREIGLSLHFMSPVVFVFTLIMASWEIMFFIPRAAKTFWNTVAQWTKPSAFWQNFDTQEERGTENLKTGLKNSKS